MKTILKTHLIIMEKSKWQAELAIKEWYDNDPIINQLQYFALP